MVSYWRPPRPGLPGDHQEVWQGQERATHIPHLIALFNTFESGMRPSLET